MRVGPLLAAGRTADVHAFGAGAVIKIPRPHTPDHWAGIEAALGRAVHDHGLPSPSVLDVVTIDGRACVVFERVDAPSMWQCMCDEPSRVPALTAELVRVQRLIHSSGIPAEVPAFIARLRSKVLGCDLIDGAERAEAERIVAALPRGAALLHGDLHPGNVLLGVDGPVVIDWFDAAIGHPIADVVRSSLLLRIGFEDARVPSRPSTTHELLRRTHMAYLDAWRATLSLEDQTIGLWEPVLALARISEGADEDFEPLLELWKARSAAHR